jgi:hypothetical protein
MSKLVDLPELVLHPGFDLRLSHDADGLQEGVRSACGERLPFLPVVRQIRRIAGVRRVLVDDGPALPGDLHVEATRCAVNVDVAEFHVQHFVQPRDDLVAEAVPGEILARVEVRELDMPPALDEHRAQRHFDPGE